MKSNTFLKAQHGKEFKIYTKVSDTAENETCVIHFKLLCRELEEFKNTTSELSPSLKTEIVSSVEYINTFDPLIKQKIEGELTRAGEIKFVKTGKNSLWVLDDDQVFELLILS